jgi:peptidoglycan/xylan/chitin deacetylase (PgdA/CDA1 family)
MNVEQLADWATEPRLPHHLPLWIGRRYRYRTRPRPPADGPIQLALTFDVEQDLGSNGTPERFGTCAPFLDWLGDAAARNAWRSTLFVQGWVAEPLADRLRQLGPAHELGLHGYFHELWGRPLWFTHQPGTPRYLRPALLAAGLRAFERAGLPRPRSFRAPNLVADTATLTMLEQADFALDSSGAAFRGSPPLPSRRGRLLRIPVSASPRPRLHRRFGLPTWAPYRLLNVPTFLYAPEDELLDVVCEIVGAQQTAAATPHLVVLAHPWEFADLDVSPCSTANYQRLLDRVRLLQNHFPIEPATLSEVAERACPRRDRGPAAGVPTVASLA